MPLGDADIASGVFFSDFGVTVGYGNQSAKGNLDAPGQDSQFADNVSVSNQDFRVEVAATAFNPIPSVDDILVVDGQRYKLCSSSPLDDGATTELKLRKLR